MKTRYSAWLNGQALHDVAPALYILDVIEKAPEGDVALAAYAGRDGQRVLRRSRQSLSVDVYFAIRDQDPTRRKAALEAVIAWAAPGGWLSLSDRPDQRLHVDMDRAPTITSALKWTDTLILTLTAYEVPFWEQTHPATVQGEGTEGSATLFVPGTAPAAPLSYTARNTGAAPLTTLTVEAAGRRITLTGLNIAPGESVSVTYDHTGLQLLPVDKRTEDSADDLLLPCGQRTGIAWSADQSVSITFEARGRYL